MIRRSQLPGIILLKAIIKFHPRLDHLGQAGSSDASFTVELFAGTVPDATKTLSPATSKTCTIAPL
eukprot:4709396-Pleurochrysis_carterae.AAC.3